MTELQEGDYVEVKARTIFSKITGDIGIVKNIKQKPDGLMVDMKFIQSEIHADEELAFRPNELEKISKEEIAAKLL